nr:alcohol dehydrogenase catalytic domain-containing protein [Chloroflexaceae bacterium]
MKDNIPRTMRALELQNYDGGPEGMQVVEKMLPALKPGEVLIRMTAAPINPSDLMFVRGMYGIKKELPVVPGLEGSGTVVAGGGGLAATALVGRRVACAAPN